MSISKRVACTRRAMELWQIHGEKYYTNISRYQDLLQKKQTMGIEPLRKIQKSILQEYPKVPFLMLTSKIEAEGYLERLSIVDIENLIHRIEYVTGYDHAYRTVSERVVEFQYQVDHYGQKSAYGIDPDSISGRKRGRNHKMDDKK